MTVTEIRRKYLDFFRERGHTVIPSARLVPDNDPTTLFTSSGMQPLVPYLLGQPHPLGVRLADSQKSFRAGDIEEVGDNRHTTFFEMLGNWSLGDYFKKEQLPWFFEYLTEVVGLDPKKLYVTVFAGAPELSIPKDEESIVIWRGLFKKKGIDAEAFHIGSEENGYTVGMQGARIFAYDAKKNWWSRSGTPDKMPVGEPGGPDSEVFYDFGLPHDPRFGNECHPNCDCGRFMEIGNSVFMEYLKQEDGSFAKLPKANVDFGGGLERISAAANNNPDVFLIDTMQLLVREIAAASGKNYDDEAHKPSFRVVADHMRAAVFMMGDGVRPSNTEQGYILRRLIRRSVRHMDKLGIGEGTAGRLVDAVVRGYEDHYPELRALHGDIHAALLQEESKFRKTLTQGMREFEKLVTKGKLDVEAAFTLFTTYGFPFEVTQELASERGIRLSKQEYDAAMQKHKAGSRAGATQKFAGGLADHQEQTVKYHTTHHLLLRVLQDVLGKHVHQRGSNITSERLRFDFSHTAKMTPEEIAKTEELMNQKIAEGLPVFRNEMPKTEAEKLGAEMEFGVKYGERVSVYSIGPSDATEENRKIAEAYSLEFCGGPHVINTSVLGEGGKRFKILKEEAVGQGIRRIKAVLT